jgi:hypothetical protein
MRRRKYWPFDDRRYEKATGLDTKLLSSDS